MVCLILKFAVAWKSPDSKSFSFRLFARKARRPAFCFALMTSSVSCIVVSRCGRVGGDVRTCVWPALAAMGWESWTSSYNMTKFEIVAVVGLSAAWSCVCRVGDLGFERVAGRVIVAVWPVSNASKTWMLPY